MDNSTINIIVGMHFYSLINEHTCPRMKKLRLRKAMSQRMASAEETKLVLICRGSPWWVTARLHKEDGRLWMEDGRGMFANAMQLQYLDIISFCYVGDARFVATVFDVSHIRSPYNEISLEHEGQNLEACACESESFDAVKVAGAGSNGEMWGRKACFEVEVEDCLKGKNARLVVPTEFAEVTKLEAYSRILLIQGDFAVGWEVVLQRANVEGDVVGMVLTTGWRTFLAANKIKVGDFLIFEVDDEVEREESTLNLKFDIVRDTMGVGFRPNRVFIKVIMPGDDKRVMPPQAISKELDRVKLSNVSVKSCLDPQKCFRWPALSWRWASIMKCNGEEEMGMIFQANNGAKDVTDVLVNIGKGKEKVNSTVHGTGTHAPKGGETTCNLSLSGKCIGESSATRARDAGVIRPRELRPLPHIFQTADITSTMTVSMHYLYSLEIRREFVRGTKLHLASAIKLVCVDGREWDITLKATVHNDGEHKVRFTDGWRQFFLHYNLGRHTRCLLLGQHTAPHSPPPTRIGIRINV